MTKKIIALILLLLLPLALTGCDKNIKTYNCYEHIEYYKNIDDVEFSQLDYTNDFTTYKLTLNIQEETFTIYRVHTNETKETITGTFLKTETSYIFSYDDAINQTIEQLAGKEEYFIVNKELHLNHERNIETATKVIGDKIVKFK
ncbi:MAG: hypothetical protein WC278_02795 [Bacilli bacterium]|jgi:hypothetical protein|nr:hypothetical protein [Bacilli bacterium]MDD2681956.1 hypothetical protein [Bacilli bacterium]MDD3121287.1 hypothetical protein [Bacilli bacterium]MDD4063462.1 hypothetical protein [Bacilli bacterium]MDD4482123.1 hypothetical protein [Bacilli bacterium]